MTSIIVYVESRTGCIQARWCLDTAVNVNFDELRTDIHTMLLAVRPQKLSHTRAIEKKIKERNVYRKGTYVLPSLPNIAHDQQTTRVQRLQYNRTPYFVYKKLKNVSCEYDRLNG